MKYLLVLLSLMFTTAYAQSNSEDTLLYQEINRVLSEIPSDFGGGCSVNKAFEMAKLIKANKLKTTLDIGIYRGRSFFPQAIAHKLFTGGVVYGVDPYTNIDAVQNDNLPLKDQLSQFAKNTNFEQIYQEVMKLITNEKVENNSTIIRMRSDQAAPAFAQAAISFGLIHVDGNHDAHAVLQDVFLFEPLLASGGFLVMDDVSWTSVAPALDYLSTHPKMVYKKTVQTPVDDYMIFQKK